MIKELLLIWEKARSTGIVEFKRKPIRCIITKYCNGSAPVLVLYTPWRDKRTNANAPKS